jgi:hypothetical protein
MQGALRKAVISRLLVNGRFWEPTMPSCASLHQSLQSAWLTRLIEGVSESNVAVNQKARMEYMSCFWQQPELKYLRCRQVDEDSTPRLAPFPLI